MKKTIFYLFLCLGVCSCSNYPNRFKKTVKPEKSEFKKISFSEITESGTFYNTKDYIIVQDIYSHNEGIFIFEKNSLSYITKTGKVGKGPDEIGRYGGIYCNDQFFYVSDFGKQKIWKFNIDSVVSDENYIPTPIIDFEITNDIDPENFFVRNDTLFFSSIDNSYFRKHIGSGKTLPIGDKNISHQRINKMVNKEIRANHYFTFIPNRSKIALGLGYDNVMVVLDSNFNLISKYIEGEKPVYQSDVFSDKRYYYNLKSDTNFIYATYFDGEPAAKKDNAGNPKGNWPNKFRVFDWECNPIAEFQFESDFFDFYVDNENKRIIIYQLNSKNPLKYFDYDIKSH